MNSITVVGAVCFGICIFLAVVVLPYVNHMQTIDEAYDEGWEACMDAHDLFEMTPDDERVLKELKSALWAHMKNKGYQRSGDKKKLDRVADFGSLKASVWETLVLRKEQ